ncbi:hypothetical protein ALC62_08670 [Cyphomyrmex costatus]|uniref:Uncharacterized protein n=1 Tax=Cyphomyrmex costatus TaxID=456900 RepID=A0A195CIK3_9HYME|nr:hypothetical protein ALC62_08670 [Cyphomyrmex costatus]
MALGDAICMREADYRDDRKTDATVTRIDGKPMVIQGGVIPAELFHEDVIPNLVDLVSIPKIGELSHNFATSAASAASSAFNDFRTYIDNFRTGLGQRINIPPEYTTLHRFVHGDIWPNFADTAPAVVPGPLVAPRLIGNYRGIDGSAASAGAASSAASRRLAKY